MYEAAEERNFILGVKLVRGAYMEKERKRAGEKSLPSPIQPNKIETDKDFNEAVRFCINHIDKTGLIVATHNEESNLLVTQFSRCLKWPSFSIIFADLGCAHFSIRSRQCARNSHQVRN